MVPFSPPDITEEEIEAVSEVLRSGWITTGPRTKQLEKELAAYMGTERAVCLNSATACLEMTLRVLGIGPGDEVITSAYTYTASASPVLHVGAKLVLVDTSPDSYEMDYEKLAAAVTERTKALYRSISEGSCVIMTGSFRLSEKRRTCSIRILRFRRNWGGLRS